MDMKRERFAAALVAAVMVLGCIGCSSNKNKDSSKAAKKNKDKSSSSSSVANNGGDELVTGDQSEVTLTAADGKYIMQAYDLLQSGQYSMRLVYTDPAGNETEIYRVVDGEDYYELQTNEIGSSGCVCVGGSAYDFDNVCGIYRKRTAGRPESLIETVVEQGLPATDTNIDPDDMRMYEVEEYTYTGGTYITVMDFYFDRETGLPVKYETMYKVEEENGDEGMTEVRTIKEIIFGSGGELVATDGETRELDRTVFDTSFLSVLVDFDSMTPEQRLGYCQAIFVTAGVTVDELISAAITEDKLKYISYEEFTSLVYTYGYDL